MTPTGKGIGFWLLLLLLVPIVSQANVSMQKGFSLVALGATPNEQDSLQISVRLTAEVLHSGMVTSTIVLPTDLTCLSPLEVQSYQSAQTEFVGEWILDVANDGYFLVEVVVALNPDSTALSPPLLPDQTFECYVNVSSGVATAFSLRPDPAYTVATEDAFDPETALSVASLDSTGMSEVGAPIWVNISGRVTFSETNSCYSSDPQRGVPGLRVKLDWDEDNSPSEQWRPYYGGNVEGVDFATTNMDGYFSFNFYFTYPGGLAANQLATFIRVYVPHQSPAAFYGDNTNPLTDYFAVYADIDIQNDTYTVFHSLASPINVGRSHGGPMRFLYRAREYCIKKLAFTPAALRYYTRADWPGTNADTFYGPAGNDYGGGSITPFINFDTYVGANVTYHEYGHRVDDIFDGVVSTSGFPNHGFFAETDYGNAWREGWAEYFGGVTCEYWYVREPQLPFEWGSGPFANIQFLDIDNYMSVREHVQEYNHDPFKVEGIVAEYLYQAHDSHSTRATGYSGDNDDVSLNARMILDAFNAAEPGSFPFSGNDRLPIMNEVLRNNSSTAIAASLDALYYSLVLNEDNMRSATPTNVSAALIGGDVQLAWNNNVVPGPLFYVPGGGFCRESVRAFQNAPVGHRVYRRVTESVWNGTLTDYTLAQQTSGTAFSWEDNDYSGEPVSYVIVAVNAAGLSVPSAETRLIPPAFVYEPLSSEPVHDMLSIVASVKPRDQIIGFSIASEFTSFDVHWGEGSSPTIWSEKGITYNVSRTTTHQQQSIATWNTGVVPDGDYTLQIVAHYGTQAYTASRLVTVDHKQIFVAASGGDYTSIQTAIDNAEMGDSVIVKPSGPSTVHAGKITMKQTVPLIADGPGIVLKRGAATGAVVEVNGGFYTILDGFTITHEHSISEPTLYSSDYGLKVIGANPIIKNCVFKENRATTGAGVLVTGNSSPMFENCTFVDNVASNNGGGLAISSGSNTHVTFRGCTFSGNQARTSSGSAVSMVPDGSYAQPGPSYAFEECNFFDNGVPLTNIATLHVGAIATAPTRTQFTGCVFAGNADKILADIATADAEFTNCTIVSNACIDRVLKYIDGAVTIALSITANNDGPLALTGQTSGINLSKTILFDNDDQGRGPTDAFWAAAGVASYAEDPAFCAAAAGDYALYAFSPAAPGVHFTERVGALDVGCVPDAIVSAAPFPIPQVGDTTLVFACPAGDGGKKLVVTVDFDDEVVTREIQASEIVLQSPPASDTLRAFDEDGDGKLAASGPASGPGFVTTIEQQEFGGTGTDALTVMINGVPLAAQANVNIRTPDTANPSGPGPDGTVSVADLAAFGANYPPPKPYNYVFDFNGDGMVSSGDFAAFGSHWGHTSTHGPMMTTPAAVAQSSAGVSLQFTEEYVTSTDRRLYVDLDLNGIAGVQVCVLSFRTGMSALELLAWEGSGSPIGDVLFTPTVRDGAAELFFGILVSESFEGSSARLGRLVFDVETNDPLEIGDDSFQLTVGDLQMAGDNGQAYAASMSSIVGRTLDPNVAQVFHNRMEQNFPNPFNPNTTIAFSLKSSSNVSLMIYDVGGRRVRELVNEKRNAGAYRVDWNGRNENGQPVASGVYFYKLVAGSFTDTKKMAILK